MSLCQNVIGQRLVASPLGAYGYSVSRKAAKHICARATPVRTRADWPCDISRLNALAADPHVVGHPADQAAQSFLEIDRRAAYSAAREEKIRAKRASHGFSSTYWLRKLRKLRKQLDPQRIRKVFARQIS